MDEQSRKTGVFLNITMGATLSFFLSLVSSLISRDGFTVSGFLLSLAVSFALSLLVGFSVRISMIEGMICGMAGVKDGTMGARVLGALVADLIYTPFISLCMNLLSWFMAGKSYPFGSAFLRSFLISFAVAFVINFIAKPIFAGIAQKRYADGGKDKK